MTVLALPVLILGCIAFVGFCVLHFVKARKDTLFPLPPDTGGDDYLPPALRRKL
jgi:hypothetical protein